ncbi:MAG TPA: dihydrolipoyl dehydrogenase [Myxococcota bacterium]|nr:dihydrolipoyl dehydrogenase [Myxococcota bacterium]
MMKNYDVIVIGSGPGGYVAAVRAAQQGLKTAIVEKDKRLGGTCLLRGCIPTKSLLHSADLLESLRHAKDHGIVAGEVGFDFGGVQKARETQVTKGAAGVQYLMKSNKIDVVAGHGRLKDRNTVVVKTEGGQETLTAKSIILATGSVPRHIPSIKIDGKSFVTSDEILELKKVPKSLIVLGAGAVGVEFASVYTRFGAKVTVVEMQDALVPVEDADVSKEFERLFKKRGIASYTGTKLEKAEVKGGEVVATLATKDKTWTETAEMLLVAIGRAPVTQDIGLDAVGVNVDKGGYVEVDTLMRTSVPNIYAIGDIVRTPWLAHVASAEGIVAVDHMAGKAPHPLNYLQVPGCTYSDPEIGSIGLTERAAKEKGYTVKVGKFPFSAVPKARILGNTDGFVKIVSDAKYDEVLGVHIIGPHATDLVAEACVALRLECTTEELAHTIHAHPTLSEGVLEAAHAAMGRPIHM